MAASVMTYCCCICHEDLGTSEKPKELKPLLTTKCGHLFHTCCLQKFFSNSGNNLAWGPKTCPACKTSLTIATDTITIFPSIVAMPETVTRPSFEEMTARISLLKSQIVELSSRLEISFLKTRESEKIATRCRADNEALAGKLNLQMKTTSEYISQLNWLASSNLQLQNNVLSLSNRLVECSNPPFPPYFMRSNGPIMRPYFPPLMNSAVGPRRSFPPPITKRGILGSPPRSINTPPRLRVDFKATNTALEEVKALSAKFMQAVSIGGDKNDSGFTKFDGPKNENGPTTTIQDFQDTVMMNESSDTKIVEKDGNDNRPNGINDSLEEQKLLCEKQSFWKYWCDKCKISWENSGGQDPPRNFCHSCYKTVLPYSQMGIE